MKRGVVVAALLVLAIAATWAALGWVRSARREADERAAAAALKQIASAEADFRGNDRDGNRILDFWTGNVAGLLGLDPPIAAADVAGPSPVPYRGYLFVAMEYDDSGLAPERYRQDEGDRHAGRFGFCAYPADYPRSGRWTFVINEGNTIFKQDLGGMPLLRWPSDDVCKRCFCRPHPGRPCMSCLQ